MRSGCANGLRKNAQRGSEAEGATDKYDYISEPGELRRRRRRGRRGRRGKGRRRKGGVGGRNGKMTGTEGEENRRFL